MTGRAALSTALFASANFFGFMLVFGLNTWLPQLMRGAGYALGSSLQFLLVLNLGAILGGLLGAWLADRIGPRTVATSFFVLAAISLGLLATFNSSFAVTQLLVFMSGMSAVGVQAILWGYVATHYPPRSRATALSVTSGIGRLGAASGPIIGGLLVGAGVGLTGNITVFAAAAVLGGLATVLVPRIVTHGPQQGVLTGTPTEPSNSATPAV